MVVFQVVDRSRASLACDLWQVYELLPIDRFSPEPLVIGEWLLGRRLDGLDSFVNLSWCPIDRLVGGAFRNVPCFEDSVVFGSLSQMNGLGRRLDILCFVAGAFVYRRAVEPPLL